MCLRINYVYKIEIKSADIKLRIIIYLSDHLEKYWNKKTPSRGLDTKKGDNKNWNSSCLMWCLITRKGTNDENSKKYYYDWV